MEFLLEDVYKRQEVFPAETVAKMGKYGFMGIPVPKEYGGQGCDPLTYVMCVEELSDVYKRQEVMSICNNFEGALMKAIRSLEQHVDSLMSYDFTGLTAVSYTHLDVYKRQAHTGMVNEMKRNYNIV